ncbi:hypothetical protein ACFQHN_10145 [Natrialbaceae archaeon GCM10025896]
MSEYFNGYATLHRLPESIQLGDSLEESEYYVISSVSSAFADESMAFPADENGGVISWSEAFSLTPRNHEGAVAELERLIGEAGGSGE